MKSTTPNLSLKEIDESVPGSLIEKIEEYLSSWENASPTRKEVKMLLQSKFPITSSQSVVNMSHFMNP